MSKYFDLYTATFKDIPSACYYVLSNDTFVSGWSIARNKTNVCVVPCSNRDEAERVARYARNRVDQKYVRIVTRKPRSKPHVLYSLVEGWLETSQAYT